MTLWITLYYVASIYFSPCPAPYPYSCPKNKKSTERREWEEREGDGELRCERGAELKGDFGRDCLERIGEVEWGICENEFNGANGCNCFDKFV